MDYVVKQPVALAPGTEVIVDAAIGNLTVTGIDEDKLYVTATRLVRLRSRDHAEAAINALVVTLEKEPQQFHVRTAAAEDMTTFDCTYYRIDLTIECPRTSPLRMCHTRPSGVP